MVRFSELLSLIEAKPARPRYTPELGQRLADVLCARRAGLHPHRVARSTLRLAPPCYNDGAPCIFPPSSFAI